MSHQFEILYWIESCCILSLLLYSRLFIVLGVVEVPACILSYAAYDHFGPQKPLALLTSLAGCSLFVISFIPSGIQL